MKLMETKNKSGNSETGNKLITDTKAKYLYLLRQYLTKMLPILIGYIYSLASVNSSTFQFKLAIAINLC